MHVSSLIVFVLLFWCFVKLEPLRCYDVQLHTGSDHCGDSEVSKAPAAAQVMRAIEKNGQISPNC